MPFVGRDWRSPGEEWVKTDEGWERKKLLERLLRSNRERLTLEDLDNRNDHDILNNNSNDTAEVVEIVTSDDSSEWQPYCPVIIKCTREIAGFNGLGEAFKRLDFRNAVKDVRRFNYICKLLHLIITQNVTSLSGCAQRLLFTMLEEIAFQVSNNQTNIHILQKLLGDLQKTMYQYYCWGRPLGSSRLRDQHVEAMRRISSMVNRIEIKKPQDDMFPKFQDLPEECIREVLLRLSDHKDLQNSGQAYGVVDRLLNEQYIWRELCKFHFTNQQIDCALGNSDIQLLNNLNWQQLYHKLRRLYGLREEYAEILILCRHCRCLFWKSFGHPCFVSEIDNDNTTGGNEDALDKSTLYVPIPPQAFLKFFSL